MHCILYQFHYDLYLKRSSYEFQNKHPTMNNARKSEFFCLKPNLKVHEIRSFMFIKGNGNLFVYSWNVE